MQVASLSQMHLQSNVRTDTAGVVQLYGSFEDERHVSLVMEHCTAGDLFKTMLVHGGVLDEHWVAIQVQVSLGC